MIIYIIIIGRFDCLSASRAWSAIHRWLGWAGGLAGQGPSAPGLAGHIGRVGHGVCIAARQGHLSALQRCYCHTRHDTQSHVTVNVPASSQDLSVQTILPRSGSLTIHPTPQWSLWWQCYLGHSKNFWTELNWTRRLVWIIFGCW